MILGLGIDIIEIDRIAQAIGRQQSFVSRHFTIREQQQLPPAANPAFIAAYYAGRFAAKEAVVKAFGTGFRGIDWRDIEIINDEKGKPFVFLAPHIAEKFQSPALMLSISHSKNTACACCIWQKRMVE